jgi:hypothetical protein
LVLKGQENIDYQLVGYVLEPVLEVLDASLSMLLENLILRVHLIKLVGDGARDNLRQDLLHSLFI